MSSSLGNTYQNNINNYTWTSYIDGNGGSSAYQDSTSLGYCSSTSCVTQNQCRSGGYSTSCIKYSLTGGTWCDAANKARSLDIYIQCAGYNGLVEAAEPSTCSYILSYYVVCPSPTFAPTPLPTGQPSSSPSSQPTSNPNLVEPTGY